MDDSRYPNLLSGYGVEAEREPYIPHAIEIEVKNPMTDSEKVSLSIAHTQKVLKIVIGSPFGRQLTYQREELQFPSNLINPIIRMNAIHQFLFPDGGDLLYTITQTQYLTQMTITDVAGIEGHIAQYGNSILCLAVMPCNTLCLMIALHEVIIAVEIMIQQLLVQFITFS